MPKMQHISPGSSAGPYHLFATKFLSYGILWLRGIFQLLTRATSCGILDWPELSLRCRSSVCTRYRGQEKKKPNSFENQGIVFEISYALHFIIKKALIDLE